MKIRQDRERFNLGANIRRFRKANRLTQEQVVAKIQLMGIDISRGSYSQIECGLYNIKVEVLLALAEIFEVSIEDFFEGMSIH